MASQQDMQSKNKTEDDSLQIYARVRGLMPWEPNKVSLKVSGNSLQNKTGSVVNSYDFKKVFKPEKKKALEKRRKFEENK